MPVQLLLTVGTLAHDNGVINNNAQGDDKAENTEHVEAGVHQGRADHGHGAQEAHGNAQHHPEGQFDFQEQGQHDEHQQRTHAQVFQHHPQPAFKVVGEVRPGIQAYPVRQLAAFFLHVRPGGPGSVDYVLLAHRKHIDAQGVLTVEGGETPAVDEPVIYGGNITQQQARTVGPGSQDDILEITLHIGLAHGAQHDVAVAGLHRAGGNIQ